MLAGSKVRDLHAHAYAVHAASKTLKRPHACFRPISLLNKNNCLSIPDRHNNNDNNIGIIMKNTCNSPV